MKLKIKIIATTFDPRPKQFVLDDSEANFVHLLFFSRYIHIFQVTFAVSEKRNKVQNRRFARRSREYPWPGQSSGGGTWVEGWECTRSSISRKLPRARFRILAFTFAETRGNNELRQIFIRGLSDACDAIQRTRVRGSSGCNTRDWHRSRVCQSFVANSHSSRVDRLASDFGRCLRLAR